MYTGTGKYLLKKNLKYPPPMCSMYGSVRRYLGRYRGPVCRVAEPESSRAALFWVWSRCSCSEAAGPAPPFGKRIRFCTKYT